MKKNYVNSSAILILLIMGFFIPSNVFAQNYCTPINIQSYNIYDISRVRLGNIDNRTARTDVRYNYYSSVETPNIKVGETIKGTISVTISGRDTNENTIIVWIDFNANNIFEDNERFLFKITDSNNVNDNKTINVPISIPIPSTATLGSSRIRIGFMDGNNYSNLTSCNYAYKSGEVEDYKINLTTGPSSLPDPLTGDYEASYCVPDQINNYGIYYISNVKLGSINNTTAGNTGSYTNFSNTTSTDVVMGETITGSVSVTMNGDNVNTNQVIVWMNFNENDHDNFDESTERFVFNVKDNRNMAYNTPKTIIVPISIPVPNDVEAGVSRMRVAFKGGNGNNYSACYFGSNVGEIEDYKIKILPKEKETDYFETLPPSNASLYFNGVNNYVSGGSFIDGLQKLTIMAWVKSDKGNTKDMVIVGEDLGLQLSLKSGNKPAFTITTEEGEKTIGDCKNCDVINFDEWHHITGSFSSSKGLMALYIDGVLMDSKDIGKEKPISVSQNANKTFEIGRFSNKLTDGKYFKGNIDEVRVFNESLTSEQIQQMVYQEIENNSGKVRGAIVKKDIQETTKGNTVSWNNLLAYYPMTDVKDRNILDYSQHEHHMTLYNLKNIQEQTAPMPYSTSKDGDWSNAATWLYGDVWDIENITNNKDWSIIKIANNVSIDNSFNTNGLIIDADKTLTVKGDNFVKNNWYLELNGTLDLLNDSQLLQTVNSDLVTSANGKILRRQEGTSNPFWYNYWASPVGNLKATTLANNNTTTHNPNTSYFRLETLKDGAGFNMQFISGHTANNSISSYWLNTYKNGVTYADWSRISKATNLPPGVGYIQKGSGVAGIQQQYIFEGKPNNGTILIDVKDKGGPGSVPSVSSTNYLVGNPYPSALNIHKFIEDNEGVISGQLQLWQQWSGSSHNLSDYNGGYALVNRMGSIRASQFVGFYGATNGDLKGTLTPSEYIAVGQGFLVEIIADGKVEFNNSQRVFIKESDPNNSYKGGNNGSVFFKNTSGKSESKEDSQKTTEVGEFKKIRLELNSTKGPATKRELLLGFSDTTSDDYDYGYDAVNSDKNNNDMHLNLDGIDMNIQAYSQITNEKIVPLNFKSSGSNAFEIKISDIENIEDAQEIYLRDNFNGTYFNLKDMKPYAFTSEQGKFNQRFEIVFQSEEKRLGVEDATVTENMIYYKNSERKLFAKKINASVTKMAIVNMLGQIAYELNNVSQDELNNGITMPNVASGAYVAYFRTDTNQVLTKKIIIN